MLNKLDSSYPASEYESETNLIGMLILSSIKGDVRGSGGVRTSEMKCCP